MAKKKSKKKKGESAPLGEGGRFAALKGKLARKKGKKKVSDPAALAAFIGRKKYGKKKFGALSKKGMNAAKRGQ